MWICPGCGEEVDRIDHIAFIDGVACCRAMVELEEAFGMPGEAPGPEIIWLREV